jgi:ParB family chromosome partitioning protein
MPHKAGLGRGLDALIPGSNGAEGAGETNFISLAKIDPNPRQPRLDMDDAEMNELAASIREHGILQPLIATYNTDTDRYTLIAGERRLRAAQLAGLDMVPVITRAASEQERLELALIENLQRSDLNPLETAEAYQKLVEEFNLSHEQIATQVGKNRTTITNTLRLLNLPEETKKALRENKITEGHARAILALEDPKTRLNALNLILRGQLNVRQAEELTKKLGGTQPRIKIKVSIPPEIKALESKLRDSLGTRVMLNHGKQGGTITIHYFSDEELEHLVSRLTGN